MIVENDPTERRLFLSVPENCPRCYALFGGLGDVRVKQIAVSDPMRRADLKFCVQLKPSCRRHHDLAVSEELD